MGEKVLKELSLISKWIEYEKINFIRCGSYCTFFVLSSEGWKQEEIYCIGHNYNHELGSYDKEVIDSPVKFGYDLFPGSLSLKNIMTGNGITVIQYCSLSNEYENENREYDILVGQKSNYSTQRTEHEPEHEI